MCRWQNVVEAVVKVALAVSVILFAAAVMVSIP